MSPLIGSGISKLESKSGQEDKPDILWQEETGDLVVWFMSGVTRTSYAYLSIPGPGNGSQSRRRSAVEDHRAEVAGRACPFVRWDPPSTREVSLRLHVECVGRLARRV